MTFKDNTNRLCKLHGTNLTTLIKECGFSSSKATANNSRNRARGIKEAASVERAHNVLALFIQKRLDRGRELQADNHRYTCELYLCL